VSTANYPSPARYVLETDRPGGSVLHGGNRAFWDYAGHESILSGPAETGKTFACLLKLDRLLLKHPGSQGVLVRKVRDTVHSTALQTYLHKVLRPAGGVRPYGGEKPQWFDYPRGGRLWLAGMDDPGKALSSERDYICVNQAEELAADDWQVLATRCTGRAGHTPAPQIFGDCNPGPPHHWVKNRPTLRLFESRHEDNPALWDAARREWTEQGRRTLAVLDALTGVRKERLRFGRWVSAEGVVYDDFDPARHVIDPFPVPAGWPRVRAVDFGFSNPFVTLWLALDPDGRLYLYRELYRTRRTVREHAQVIRAWSAGEWYAAAVADHDAEGRATLEEDGIWTLPAVKDVSRGIQAVQDRLKPAADGRPRLFLFRDALRERDESLAERRLPVCTAQEFEVYAWPKGADGKPVKEVPVDLHNHGLDALRYAVMWADQRQRVAGALPRAGGPTLVSQAPLGVFGPAGGRLGGLGGGSVFEGPSGGWH
jgi:phage terminase large subunit